MLGTVIAFSASGAGFSTLGNTQLSLVVGSIWADEACRGTLSQVSQLSK